jgi:hypothetical protein
MIELNEKFLKDAKFQAKKFLDLGDKRPCCRMPFRMNNDEIGYCSGKITLVIPSEYLPKDLDLLNDHPEIGSIPDLVNIINPVDCKSGDTILSTSSLIEQLRKSTELRPTEMNCDKCNGQGAITCGWCEHTHDCETCEGVGNYYKEGYFKLEDKFFSYSHWIRLLEIAKLVGAEKIELQERADKSAHYAITLFKVDDCMVGLISERKSLIEENESKVVEVQNG